MVGDIVIDLTVKAEVQEAEHLFGMVIQVQELQVKVTQEHKKLPEEIEAVVAVVLVDQVAN